MSTSLEPLPQSTDSQGMHVVYLALGSNLGDRAANLRRAVECLPPWVIPSAASPVYETPPWGYTDQPAFLNQVIRAETLYEPVPLLEYLKHLEVQLGRTTTFRNGPRVIDLDILLYDEIIYDSPSLTLPHPRLSERAFVLVPLVDLAPDLIHPQKGISMRQMLSKIDPSGIKTYPV